MEYDRESLKPRVLILADGKSKKDHMEDDRHLIPFRGVPLIARTIRQFHEAGGLVHVITSNEEIARVAKLNKAMVLPGSDKSDLYGGTDMIRKGLDYARNKRSIIVFGDVVFTNQAVRKIMRHEPDRWAVYGRSTASKYGGSEWAEYFAISVGPLAKKQGYKALEKVAKMFNRRMWHRITPWEWYFEMEGMHWHVNHASRVKTGDHWVEIDDETDDIDFPQDAKNLKELH